jgi:acetylornithine deacetylase/succinyl-diaminopimelate desuccinylase-like protein
VYPLAYARAHRARFLRELIDFIGIPSVSAQPRHAPDVRRCAAWLAAHLRTIGLTRVQLIPTPRHPLVCASWRGAPGRPTLLLYGHYDVQPADPLGAWHSPPFEPVLRGGAIYGRGASDDKGQLFCHLKAIEAHLRSTGRLPLNLICLFEGEEEIGSPNLRAFIARNRPALSADAAVISDTSIPAPERPALTYALRGSLGLELELRGPGRDLHSGTFGGAIHNPLQVLGELLASLHDADGRVTTPGFYRRVRLVGPTERAALARAAPANGEMLRNAGVTHGWGEPGYTLYERTTIRPALTINGISGGYQGPGGKGVIPTHATAKLGLRLVPDQDPDEIAQLLRSQIACLTPPTVRAHLRVLSAAPPVLLARDHPAMHVAASAYRQGFGADPVFLRSGGTIPVVAMLQATLGMPVVLLGLGLPSDRIHAPDEHFQLDQLERGIATCIHMLSEFSSQPRAAEPERAATS